MKTVRKKRAIKFAALLIGAAGIACPGHASQAQAAPANAGNVKSYEVDVAGTKEWVDTNVDVRGGAKLRFTATGKITYPPDDSYNGKLRTLGTFGPDGLARGWADLVHQYAVKDAGHGALIGRIGSDAYAQAFPVGASKDYDVPVAGRLFLGINQSMSEASTADGSFHVKIEVLDEGSADGITPGGASGNPSARHHSRFAEQDSAPRLRSQRQSRRHGQRPYSGDRGTSSSGIHDSRVGPSGQGGGEHGAECGDGFA